MQEDLREQLTELYRISENELGVRNKAQFAELIGIRPDTLSKAFAGKNGCLNVKLVRNARTAIELARVKSATPVSSSESTDDLVSRLLAENAEKDRQIDRLLSLLEDSMKK